MSTLNLFIYIPRFPLEKLKYSIFSYFCCAHFMTLANTGNSFHIFHQQNVYLTVIWKFWLDNEPNAFPLSRTSTSVLCGAKRARLLLLYSLECQSFSRWFLKMTFIYSAYVCEVGVSTCHHIQVEVRAHLTGVGSLSSQVGYRHWTWVSDTKGLAESAFTP